LGRLATQLHGEGIKMRYFFTVALCFVFSSQLHGQSTSKTLRISEHVFEIDRVSLAQQEQKVPEGVVDVRSLLSSKLPVTLEKSAEVQVGDSVYQLSKDIQKKQGGSDIHTWGNVSMRANAEKRGTTTHGIGTEICFLDVSPINGLLPMVGIYHVAEDAPKRLEGEPTTFLAGMVRMLPIEVRFPKEGELVEEFAVPLSTVVKVAKNDPSLKGFLTEPEDPRQIVVGLHGLEFSFSYWTDEDKVHLSQFRYLLSQIVDREKLPGLALDAGKPTIVVDGGTVDIEFSHNEMVVIHLTSEQERDGGNPLLLVLTSELVNENP
jgi:hypothetical protein